MQRLPIPVAVGVFGAGVTILFGTLAVDPPTWLLIPLLTLSVGMVLVSVSPLILMVGNLIRRIRLRIPFTLTSTNAGARGDTAHSKPSVFDPYTISSQLAQVDLSGLSEPDSFMMITLHVRNVSGYPVTITGVKGRIRCAGAECNMAATVEREPIHLPNSSNLVACTIRQPLSNGMMNAVALAGDLLISLSSLQWVGSVVLPQGSVPLKGCYIQEDFVVKGPWRDEGALFRLMTTFLSSERYNSDGTPKRNG